jgi:hypothetical protein
VTEPRLYFFINPAYCDQIYWTQTHNVWEAFARHGATLVYGEDIHAVHPNPEDHVIGYGRVDNWKDSFFRFNPKNRWHYIVDESSFSTGPYEIALDMLQKLGYQHKKFVVTYQNAAHLATLQAKGVKYVIMPQTMPAIRPRVDKSIDIVISGQMSSAYYPTRTRLKTDLMASPLLRGRIHHIDSPGVDKSTRKHNVINEQYYELLDKCRLGVVCRAGSKDRMVGKYVEMGACHVLPVGDCPTYMPLLMKEAMVDVDKFSPQQVPGELLRLLKNPTELQQRSDAFTAEVEKHFLADDNARRAVKEILGTVTD